MWRKPRSWSASLFPHMKMLVFSWRGSFCSPITVSSSLDSCELLILCILMLMYVPLFLPMSLGPSSFEFGIVQKLGSKCLKSRLNVTNFRFGRFFSLPLGTWDRLCYFIMAIQGPSILLLLLLVRIVSYYVVIMNKVNCYILDSCPMKMLLFLFCFDYCLTSR